MKHQSASRRSPGFRRLVPLFNPLYNPSTFLFLQESIDVWTQRYGNTLMLCTSNQSTKPDDWLRKNSFHIRES
jgi:hypothetical protein